MTDAAIVTILVHLAVIRIDSFDTIHFVSKRKIFLHHIKCKAIFSFCIETKQTIINSVLILGTKHWTALLIVSDED